MITCSRLVLPDCTMPPIRPWWTKPAPVRTVGSRPCCSSRSARSSRPQHRPANGRLPGIAIRRKGRLTGALPLFVHGVEPAVHPSRVRHAVGQGAVLAQLGSSQATLPSPANLNQVPWLVNASGLNFRGKGSPGLIPQGQYTPARASPRCPPAALTILSSEADRKISEDKHTIGHRGLPGRGIVLFDIGI